MEPFFNIRPSKRSNPEARTTLDTVHQHNLTKVKDIGEQIQSWNDQYNALVDRYMKETDDVERYKLEHSIKEIQHLKTLTSLQPTLTPEFHSHSLIVFRILF